MTNKKKIEKDSVNNRSEGKKKTQAKKTNRKRPSSTRQEAQQKEIESLREERDSLNERLLRKAAEFENYKRRTENEVTQIVSNANAGLISDLLPILDDIERSLATFPENSEAKSVGEGISLIYKNLQKVFDKYGVSVIKSVGEPFDPELHEALLQVENAGQPSGTVVEEHLKGYSMNGRVLRHSQVIVTK